MRAGPAASDIARAPERRRCETDTGAYKIHRLLILISAAVDRMLYFYLRFLIIVPPCMNRVS